MQKRKTERDVPRVKSRDEKRVSTTRAPSHLAAPRHLRDGSRRHAARRPRRGRGRGHRRGGFPGRAHRCDGIQAHVPWERFVQVRGGARRALAPREGRRQRRDAGGGDLGRRRGTRAVGPPVPALLQRHERTGTSHASAEDGRARATRRTADGTPTDERSVGRAVLFFLGVFVFVSFLASRRASRGREQRARPPPKQNTNDT